ncbi:hypothetical protein [Pseudomonas sp. CFBP 8772]|uniref:hypothetical protein n=1 Tax=Pseudomonas sp. CFBP 8772 TaxID=2775284 RepID=UPI00177B4457|nr:hypothetical protein [Pseudomonas sp. CFBP 8772]MBD8597455.1 hypothetical protein [Pseudomonas sp. CFBP 8772]
MTHSTSIRNTERQPRILSNDTGGIRDRFRQLAGGAPPLKVCTIAASFGGESTAPEGHWRDRPYLKTLAPKQLVINGYDLWPIKRYNIAMTTRVEIIGPCVPMLVTLASSSRGRASRAWLTLFKMNASWGNATRRRALRFHDLHVAFKRRDLAELISREGNAHLAAWSDQNMLRLLMLYMRTAKRSTGLLVDTT